MKQCWPCTMYEPICTAETHGECDCPKCQGLCECDKIRDALADDGKDGGK